MPEGDTVFLTAHRLHEALAGKTLTGGEVRHPRLAAVTFAGRLVTEVVPVGKHLFVRFDDDRSLHSHLRMDGSWHLYAPGERWRMPGHHARVVLVAADREAVGFRLHDLDLVPRAREGRYVDRLGPDLLVPQWTPAHQAEAERRLAARPDRAFGLALLDQSVVAGIGNVYVNELCFLVGTSPHAPVSDVPEYVRGEVLAKARELLWDNRLRVARTTTGSTARGSRHWVYDRARRPCRRCGTPVATTRLGDEPEARTSWFCPRCQPAP
ncbi:MAG: Fpg/Nei family DNA glycosylase [Streptosporangiales bacterium]|nr:Fpg/Nei family DNA glycosylase [Streptosporangiales bacterium]MBO0890829.1 Fpg/Nei family DNA glycosylase [Acidothermales bacterium]